MIGNHSESPTLKERTTRSISDGRVRIPPKWLRAIGHPEVVTIDHLKLEDGTSEVRLRFE